MCFRFKNLKKIKTLTILVTYFLFIAFEKYIFFCPSTLFLFFVYQLPHYYQTFLIEKDMTADDVEGKAPPQEGHLFAGLCPSLLVQLPAAAVRTNLPVKHYHISKRLWVSLSAFHFSFCHYQFFQLRLPESIQ